MSTQGFGPSACLRPHRGILLLSCTALCPSLSVLLAPGAGLCGRAGQHSPSGSAACWTSRNINNHKRGLRVYMPEIDCQGAHPTSATYSAHVNFITINAILKREKRLLQRGKESMQKMNGVARSHPSGPADGLGRSKNSVQQNLTTSLTSVSFPSVNKIFPTSHWVGERTRITCFTQWSVRKEQPLLLSFLVPKHCCPRSQKSHCQQDFRI